MPATVTEEPLAVHFTFSDGSAWTANLPGLPNPQLARDLADGLAAITHPHGQVNSRSTAIRYGVAIRRMVHDLAQEGFTGSAAELSRPLLLHYWMSNLHHRERETRLLLRGYDMTCGGLRPDVREHLAGRQIHRRDPTRPYRAYSSAEWQRLELALRQMVEDQWSQRRAVMRLAGVGGDPREREGSCVEDLAWLMQRDGPYNVVRYGDYVRGHVTWSRRALSDDARWVCEGLFPSRQIQLAYQLLFGIYTGVVPDGIADLGLHDVEWTGDATVLLSYVKGRTGPEGIGLSGRAVRLLERWLALSAPLRALADESLRGRLWIAADARRPDPVIGPPPNSSAQRRLAQNQGLLDDLGEPLVIHRGRIRATFHELLARRGWTGRATIDPNHTAKVEGDHYATPSTPAEEEAVEDIIVDGQADVLRRAHRPVVLTTTEAAQLAEGFPGDVVRLGLDDTAIAALVGGERDVFTAACADQLAGLHGPKGKPCPARPWVCLLCPLAVFLPRHAPNLLRLKAFFARQFQQMPTSQFLRVFGAYADRLDTEIIPRLPARALTQAQETIDTADESQLPLRPEELTT